MHGTKEQNKKNNYSHQGKSNSGRFKKPKPTLEYIPWLQTEEKRQKLGQAFSQR